MSCKNCKFFHPLKHNFETGKGFEKAYACDMLLHIEGKTGWIQEVNPDDKCEMYTEVKHGVNNS